MSYNRRTTTMTDAFIEIVFIVMLLIAAFMLSVGGFRAYEAYSSQAWPTAEGLVLVSRVETLGDSAGSRAYRSRIRYVYEAGLGTFEGDRIGPDPSEKLELRSEAEAELTPYPKDAIISVYYNPNRPQRSMLEPAFEPSKLINPGIGLLVLIGAFTLRFYKRRSGETSLAQG
ncbi:MAG: DUF3592 domain-containing protein [Anaerolineae bacterium]